jgi:hypothetical protein
MVGRIVEGAAGRSREGACPLTMVFEATNATAAGGMLRGLLVDPWRRGCRPVSVPTRPLSCGCPSADGLALVDLLGRRRQRAYPVLANELLIVGIGVSAPSWTWGAEHRCHGFGLILSWGHTLSDSCAALHEVERFVEFRARQRARAEAA